MFSFIIPTYNRGHLIVNTLQSLITQTYPHFEIIVVDDGSTDNTEEIVKSIHSDKIRYFKIPNSERGYARNFGASKATGLYLNFFDSDDIAYPNHLQTAYQIISENNNIPFFHLGYDSLGHSKKNTSFSGNKQLLNKNLIKGNPLSCNAVFIHKDIFQQFRFNEDRTISGLEDWELWLRISTKYEIKHFPIITSAIIQHENRSVLQTDKNKLIQRVTTFMNIVLNNKNIIDNYRPQLHLFKCSCYTYISLHLALTGKHKKDTLYYLLKGIKENPSFIFQRRFFAILKHLLK
ncbi:MAG: glycosyltransferase family 2 protein [Bacteroidia bacterium]